MVVLPVMDVRRGRVVHASGGDRERYPPLSARFPFPDEPAAVAARLRERWGERPIYLADLGALAGEAPDLELVATLASDGFRVRVDAAVRTPDRARALLEAGAERVVVGLETLGGWAELDGVAAAAGAGRTVFSLDAEAGRPHAPGWAAPDGRPATPEAAARRAVDAGVETLQLLDLDRVGSERGPPLSLLRRVRCAVPGARLASGGGIRREEDVRAAAAAGASECLVATALYGGALPPDAVRRLEAGGG